jgi:serine/threonine protein phosphatase PrpC
VKFKETIVKAMFKRLRRKKTEPLPSKVNISTVPLSDQQIEEISKTLRVEPSQLLTGCSQSTGKQRDHNEDCMFSFTVTIGGERNNYPLGLFIVADGMGGHQYGEIASSTAVRTMACNLIKRFLPTILNPAETIDEPLQDLMRSAITEAQRAVMQAAPSSGTTLTAALILGQQLTIGHVGDSRAYAIRPDGRIEPLTRDHSLVRRLEELGQISSDEAAAHPQRNVLYRALGQGEILEPDIFTTSFPQLGYLLLCSDGLWSVVPDDDIGKIIGDAPSLQGACQNLVSAANDAGGPDNISAILVQLLI